MPYGFSIVATEWRYPSFRPNGALGVDRAVHGGYYGDPEVIIPFRKPLHGEITDWQEELNATHRRVRAAQHTLADTASGIAYLRNIAFIGQPDARRRRTAKQKVNCETSLKHHQ